ncbi:MAG: 6-carboxytetrahydropterin synthase [Methanocalculus sp. MSAO_Arc1]|uniref:6-carboxytetrahydropterin synthase n=1 Tax=Methanocalculus TaxID=71151 RepID=UPI000FF5849A|nr:MULTISPECIES: 6-carboxytetrahydropterin synthase [unclassified Methanocalculus]MCP1662664.1 6-pyruvoyltetrahydropterin/6-carboxytetrahydropterin synthase [Methanocalculus sp. AMF5]RQD80305.1 MAG: 6-carboxytetrahydropterin synthase [Methanocalculus sp. MSAO_Arc1]
MSLRIYKEVFFDASHRLLHYDGKCARLHGHRWRTEVWLEGAVDEKTQILLDYNCIKNLVEVYDHQVILNCDDPMVACLSEYQDVVTTAGDPTSELLAVDIADRIDSSCRSMGLDCRVVRVRVWESAGCFAEVER